MLLGIRVAIDDFGAGYQLAGLPARIASHPFQDVRESRNKTAESLSAKHTSAGLRRSLSATKTFT